MKHLLSFLLVLSLLLCAGCASALPSPSAAESAPPVSETPEQTEDPRRAVYAQGRALLDAGDGAGAAELFASLGSYEDAPLLLIKADALAARALLLEGKTDEALALLETLPEGEEKASLLRLAELERLDVGDRVFFGRFEQDNAAENGAEPIEWLVLARSEQRLLLLSVCGLDMQPYHEPNYGETTWAECTLRAWLNGPFFSGAFSPQEQELIALTLLSTPDSPEYRTPGGEDTEDRVFLLSLDEVQEYLPDYTERLAPVTDYAAARGSTRNASGNGWWWLRDPGVHSYDAAYVTGIGELSYYGYIVSRPEWTVRPALWLDLEKALA